jgi:SAM-dependent methyltransferase
MSLINNEIQMELGDEVYNYLYKRLYRLLDEKHFSSYFLQFYRTVMLPKSKVQSVLEIGSGAGIYKALLNNFNYNLTTMDIDNYSDPNIIGDVALIPFQECSFDLICIFEVLEHLPFSNFEKAIKELHRCTRHYVYLSLPYAHSTVLLNIEMNSMQSYVNRMNFKLRKSIHLPSRFRDIDLEIYKNRKDKKNPHYWEVNRKSYKLPKILNIIESSGLSVMETFNNPFFPYHFYILCEKIFPD